MSFIRTVVLGAIAGSTIFLGLPVGRVRNPRPQLKAFLNAIAVGILIFLLWDVLSQAFEPIEKALDAAAHDGASWSRFVRYSAMFVVGIGAGFLPLVRYDRWLAKRAGRVTSFGPGAASIEDVGHKSWIGRLSPSHRIALFIAAGIGMHNFSEGLAIGQSAAKGEISLALLLIIGFALHNSTEGFGIVGPMAGDAERPSWSYLALLGLIGGGPTMLGTIVGRSFVNETVYLAFLSLAAGSILYVVIEMLNVGRKLGFREVTAWGIFLGLFVGFATDLILVAAGA